MSTELLGFELVEERQGGLRSYVSPSRLSLWMKCPLAFALRYRDGIKTPTTPSLFLGSAVHQSLEVVYRHRQLGIHLEASDVAKRLMESWASMVAEREMTFDSVDAEHALQKQAVDLVTAYLACAPTFEKPLAVEIAVESPLVDPVTGEGLGMPMLALLREWGRCGKTSTVWSRTSCAEVGA